MLHDILDILCELNCRGLASEPDFRHYISLLALLLCVWTYSMLIRAVPLSHKGRRDGLQ